MRVPAGVTGTRAEVYFPVGNDCTLRNLLTGVRLGATPVAGAAWLGAVAVARVTRVSTSAVIAAGGRAREALFAGLGVVADHAVVAAADLELVAVFVDADHTGVAAAIGEVTVRGDAVAVARI